MYVYKKRVGKKVKFRGQFVFNLFKFIVQNIRENNLLIIDTYLNYIMNKIKTQTHNLLTHSISQKTWKNIKCYVNMFHLKRMAFKMWTKIFLCILLFLYCSDSGLKIY